MTWGERGAGRPRRRHARPGAALRARATRACSRRSPTSPRSRCATRRASSERARQARIQRGFYRIAVRARRAALAARRPSTRSRRPRPRRSAASAAAVLMPDARTACGWPGRTSSRRAARAVPRGGLGDPSRALLGAARGAPRRRRAAARGRRALRRGVARRRAARAATARCSPSRSRRRRPTRRRSCSSSSREERRFTDDDLELAAPPRRRGPRRARAQRAVRGRAHVRARSRSSSRAPAALLATELDPAAVLDEVVAPGAGAARRRRVLRSGSLEGDELVVSAASGEGAEAHARLARAPSTALARRRRRPVARCRSRVADVAGEDRVCEADPLLAAATPRTSASRSSAPRARVQGVLSVYCRGAARRGARRRSRRSRRSPANASAALSNAELYQRVALEKERSVAILANIADGIVAVDRDGQGRALERGRRADHRRPGRRRARPHARARCSSASSSRAATRRRANGCVSIRARRRGGLALADRGGHARPGRRGRGPHLRVPRHLLRAASSSR